MLGHTTNTELLRQLDEMVVGHTEAKKLLITLVNRSKMSHRLKWGEYKDPLEKMNLLLIGASGTGKTFLLESLQKLVHFPLVKVDASRLNPASNMSYSYKDIQMEITKTAQALVDDQTKPYWSLEGTVDQTVVFIDEVDKLCTPYGKNDGWHSRTQGELLTLVENQDEFKRVSFVFAGAFTKLREKQKSTSIGLTSTDVGEYTEREQIVEQDLVDFGLTTELLGRITAINELDVMTESTMLTILDTLLLPNKLKELSHFIDNPIAAITDTMKQEMVEEALNSGQGVRYLKRHLNDMFLDIEFGYEARKQLVTTQ